MKQKQGTLAINSPVFFHGHWASSKSQKSVICTSVASRMALYKSDYYYYYYYS